MYLCVCVGRAGWRAVRVFVISVLKSKAIRRKERESDLMNKRQESKFIFSFLLQSPELSEIPLAEKAEKPENCQSITSDEE